MDERTKEAVRYVVDMLEGTNGGSKVWKENVGIVCEYLKELADEPEEVYAIRLTSEDVCGAFQRKHGREPTAEEYKSCLSHFNGLKFLEAMDFEKGWSVLDDI